MSNHAANQDPVQGTASEFRIAVFASGRGSNFAALLEAQRAGVINARIVALLSDRALAPAMELARAAQIPAVALKPREFTDRVAFDRALFAHAAKFSPDLIVLAGYMRIIDASVVAAWRGRMINIHPSLLPKYPGLHTHARAIAARDATHGSSVHYVTAELDGGPVIAQAELDVAQRDNADSLAQRLLPLEHRLLVAVVRAIAQGHVALGVQGVEYNGAPIAAPLRLDERGQLERN